MKIKSFPDSLFISGKGVGAGNSISRAQKKKKNKM